ncbi:MAG: hypothetical protein ACTSQJ_10285 [Promethearchaeota archaeon]
MNTSIQKKEINQIDKEELVKKLKKEAILLNHGRLLQILINLFSKEKYREKLEKREGQEIQINFPAYDIEPNCLTFILSKMPSDPYVGSSKNPKVIITFNVSEEKLITLLTNIVSTKYGFFGLLKLIFKYLLTGKIKYKPKRAIGALIATLRCFLIGNHEYLKKTK